MQIIDPVSGTAYNFDPDAVAHAYTYNGPGGAIDTDTVTLGTAQFRKTYTYTGTQLTGETTWVKL